MDTRWEYREARQYLRERNLCLRFGIGLLLLSLLQGLLLWGRAGTFSSDCDATDFDARFLGESACGLEQLFSADGGVFGESALKCFA